MELIKTTISAYDILEGKEIINLAANQKIKIIVGDETVLNGKCPDNKEWKGSIVLYLIATKV